MCDLRADTLLEETPKVLDKVIDGFITYATDLPLVVIAVDLEGKITHWSRYARVLFGFSEQEVLGRPVADLEIGIVGEGEAERVASRVAGRPNWRGELTVRGRYGNELRLHCISSPIANPSGTVIGMAGMFLDVTAYRSVLTQQATTLREMVFYGEEIRELERARIARDLHDELGQLITAIKSEARMRIADPDLDASTKEAGTRLVRACDDLIDIIHRICSELTTPVLDDFGIQDALESLIFDVADHIGARCSIDFGEIPEMDKRLRREVYRIGQQALVNAERHSNASHISVSLKSINNSLVLEVADDGVGIDHIGPDDFGLQTMRERAERLAGSLRIHRNSPSGTVVRFALPLSQFEQSAVDRRVVSRSFVEAIMRATGDITIVLNPDGTLQWIRSWAEIEAQDLWVDSLESMMTLVHPEDRNLAFSKLVDLLTGASMIERWVTIRVRDINGVYRWYEADGRNLVSVPEVGGVVVSLREVSEKVEPNERAPEQQDYYETLLKHLPSPAMLITGDGQILFANHAVAELLRAAPEVLATQTIFEYIFDRDHAATRERLDRCRLGMTDMYPLRIKRADGTAAETIVQGAAHLTNGELDFVVITLNPVLAAPQN